MRKALPNLVLVGMVLLASASIAAETLINPRKGMPDEETAIAIAVAVWIPIYGKE